MLAVDGQEQASSPLPRGERQRAGGDQALLLGLVIAIAAPAGDLFESMLKRDMGAKDTGALLGGHGGMLDRIDSILFASVAAFYTILAYTT